MACHTITRRGRHDALTVGLLTLLIAAPLHAQDVAVPGTLTGTVRDAATQQPLAGAVVTLLGDDRQAVTQALTSRTGAFRLTRRSATTLRVIRIGYQPHERPAADLGAGPLTIELMPLARTYEAMVVRATPECLDGREQRDALALWATAQDGLAALVLSGITDAHSGEVEQILYDRLLDNSGRRIVRQKWQRVTTGNAVPIRATRDAEGFVLRGYIDFLDSATVYYAPDPVVLLDSTFAETHCLTLWSDAREHPGEIGVAFAPLPGRDTIPDIAGVLWLSRAPLALTSLDFEYQGVDRVILDAGAGGRLDFETLSNGVPIIRSWHIRSPRLAYLPAGTVRRGRVLESQRVVSAGELHENGALITRGTLSDGTTLTAPLASITGRVVNDRGNTPVVGARVILDSTDVDATSDADGRFTLTGLLPGPYTVRVLDTIVAPRGGMADSAASATHLPELVARSREMKVEARLDRPVTLTVRLPWRDPLAPCYAPAAPAVFIVTGTVLTPQNVPLAGAAVRLHWADSNSAAVETVIDARTDQRGRFVVCGVPGGMAVGARVVDAMGVEHRGTMTVPLVMQSEMGQMYRGKSRFMTLIVTPRGQ